MSGYSFVAGLAPEQKDMQFMSLALELARNALDEGEFPVGCVLVADDSVVAQGARLNTGKGVRNELDHAEIVALRDLMANSVKNGEYYNGISVYTTLEPCLMCLGALILNGVERIVYALEDVMGGATGLDFSVPFTSCPSDGYPHLYSNYESRITGGVMRNESLDLFRLFFDDPGRDYWQNSLLSRYILSIEVD